MEKVGGADRDRTGDLLNAIQALSQLSYGPTCIYMPRMLERSAKVKPYASRGA